ncbi:hypothetical protein COJ85_29025, partial [Bacillus sp. AFS076308]
QNHIQGFSVDLVFEFIDVRHNCSMFRISRGERACKTGYTGPTGEVSVLRGGGKKHALHALSRSCID